MKLSAKISNLELEKAHREEQIELLNDLSDGDSWELRNEKSFSSIEVSFSDLKTGFISEKIEEHKKRIKEIESILKDVELSL